MILYQALACSFPLFGVITFDVLRPIPEMTAGVIFLNIIEGLGITER